MAIRSRWTGLVAAALIAAGTGGAQLLTAGSAQARPPGDCDVSAISNSSGEAICWGAGFNSFRATVTCSHAGIQYTNYGPWALSEQNSIAYCNYGDMLATVSTYATASVSYELS